MSELLINKIKEKLAFDIDDFEERDLSLNTFWSCSINNVARVNPQLSFFFSNPKRSTIDFYIAGSEETIDHETLKLADEVILNFETILSLLDDVDKNMWHLNSLVFPYQVAPGIWYAIFISEYGELKEFAFTQDEAGCYCRHSLSSKEDDSIYCVLPNVKYVLNELLSFSLHSNELENIFNFIETHKTIGEEVILPLQHVLKENIEQLEHMYSHLHSFLKAIEKHAKIT